MNHQRSSAPVLVVDDDASVRDALRLTLEDAGYTVAEAVEGADALEQLRAGLAPQLILLDLMMPGMDGWAFCQARRLDPALVQIPLVLLTAAGGPSRDAPYLDVAALMAKPVAPDALVRLVARVISR